MTTPPLPSRPAAPADDGPRPTLAHRAEYLAVRATFGALALLPRAAALRVGEALGMLGYRPLGIRRGVVVRQIAAAFPEWSRQEVTETARAAYAHLGRIAVETALMARLGRQQLIDSFEGADGWEHIEGAIARGSGLLVVTGHLGNWELGGAYIGARGSGIDAIARRMGNPSFDRYLTATRERLGVRIVHDSDAVRHVPRAIRQGGVVGFLSDQGVKGLASTYVPFFGRPAKTPRGPAVFALRMGTPMVFATALRQPSGRYRLFVEPVTVENTGDREHDVDATVARYTAVLERYVRRAPEQYFWHHRRWRRQPKDTPRELREP